MTPNNMPNNSRTASKGNSIKLKIKLMLLKYSLSTVLHIKSQEKLVAQKARLSLKLIWD